MGRKERREREIKRENYATKHSAEKRKQTLIAVGVLGVIAVIVGYAGFLFMNMTVEAPGGPENAGALGSDHAHAVLLVFVNGDQIDFSHPRFQLQSKYIHFENNNPYLIHKHATDVPLDMLFSSFGLEITSECIVLRGQTDPNQNCIDSKNSMTILINGKSFSNINLYEIRHNDRILISFGDSSLISNQLEQLDKLEIHDVPKSSKLVPGKDISV